MPDGRVNAVSWIVPEHAGIAIAEHVREHGLCYGVETGGFLLCPLEDDSRVSVVALTADAGIVREPYRFLVSGEAFEALAEDARVNRGESMYHLKTMVESFFYFRKVHLDPSEMTANAARGVRS